MRGYREKKIYQNSNYSTINIFIKILMERIKQYKKRLPKITRLDHTYHKKQRNILHICAINMIYLNHCL